MDNLFIDLNEYSIKKQKLFRLIIFGALLCLLLLLFSILFLRYLNKPAEYLLITSFVYLALYFYFVWVSYKTKLFIKADEKCIILKFGIRSRSKDIILWDTIRKVRIGPTYIALMKKSGRRRRYMLGWLPYYKVIEIKDKLIDFLDTRNVDYEVVDFIKYQDKVER